MKEVIIFGSTGTVGRAALDVLRQDKSNFKVKGIMCNRNITRLLRQIKEFKPEAVCVVDEKAAKKIKNHLNKSIKLFRGREGLKDFACLKCDISLMAISGIYCLYPLYFNLPHAKRVALVNKESVVAAGKLIFQRAKKFGTEIIPVDSEINALYQLIKAHTAGKSISHKIRKIYLTASGGALREHKKINWMRVTPHQILKHPVWNMGKRITIDSATLLNKGFEVVEVHRFFNFPYKDIKILLHPQSVVHGLLELKDGHIFAAAYPPSMKLPIAFSFYYPQRRVNLRDKNFLKNFSLAFSLLEEKKYPLLDIILDAAKRDDNSLVILNALDEVCIEYFLKGRIKFHRLIEAMQYIYEHYPSKKMKTLDDVFYWDRWGRNKTESFLKNHLN